MIDDSLVYMNNRNYMCLEYSFYFCFVRLEYSKCVLYLTDDYCIQNQFYDYYFFLLYLTDDYCIQNQFYDFFF